MNYPSITIMEELHRCTYEDHANEVEEWRGGSYENELVVKSHSSLQAHQSNLPFPFKLHDMLHRVDELNLSHVVSWQPHGRCFLVHDQKKFVDVVISRFFNQTKFPSFQRQLNMYGFRRLTFGRDKGAYYHELFLRGKMFLCTRIRRIKIKGNGVRTAAIPESEPNFYDYLHYPPVGLRLADNCLPVATTTNPSFVQHLLSERSPNYIANPLESSNAESQSQGGTNMPSTQLLLGSYLSSARETPESIGADYATTRLCELAVVQPTGDISTRQPSTRTWPGESHTVSDDDLVNRTSSLASISRTCTILQTNSMANDGANNESHNSLAFMSNEEKSTQGLPLDLGRTSSVCNFLECLLD